MTERQFASYLETWIPAHKDEILSCLLNLIRIPSVGTEPSADMPFGVEVDRAYRFYLDKANEMGMVTKNVDGYAVHAEIGSGEKMAMALTHVDIVPIGAGWSMDPLGEISDGVIYGRGASDNKGPTVACLYAMKALKESGAPLTMRVRHVVGGNEESGFGCVRHYFKVEPQPTYGFSPDAMFPLVYAEKGSMKIVVSFSIEEDATKPTAADKSSGMKDCRVLHFSGGERANIVAEKAEALLSVPQGKESWAVARLESEVQGVQDIVGGPGPLEFTFQEGDGTVKIVAKGKPAHASTPLEGTNALAGLAHLLTGLSDRLEEASCFDFIAKGAESRGKGFDIESCDDISGELTCNLGVATTEASEGRKVLHCIYDIRYPVRASGEDLRDRALRCARPEGVSVKVPSLGKPHYSDPESTLVKSLLRIYREETGDFSPPLTMGGGTYARVIDGGVAFGPALPGSPQVAHQPDERITVDDLMLMIRIYARALFALATE